MPPVLDLTAQQFGRLVVIDYVGGAGAKWRCRCSCGAECRIAGGALRAGKTVSCGCLRLENTAAMGRRFGRENLARGRAKIVESQLRHGHTVGGVSSKTYSAWSSMLERCGNPKHRSYSNYGGRGITVCERWRTFEHFLADMGEPPTPQHSIERDRTDGNYEPTNCRWATRVEQARNTRRTRFVDLGGERVSIAEAAERCGLPYATLYARLSKLNWPTAIALAAAPLAQHDKRRGLAAAVAHLA